MLVADRYRLGDLLGRGGMGEVWRAHDEVLGRQVAVKLLLGDDGDESSAARFRMEAQTAARLNHPQVVAVYDFGAWEGRFYLVMELVQGPSLADLSARGAFAPERVADIAAQAASGLAAAHRQGVVHRDVKPGNLMLDADGTLKIGDFGIARFVDETSAALTRAGQIVGTSTYLAPERALGRMAGPGSDVYALGCVLYQLLVGQPPFWADSPTALLYLHVDAEPVPPRRHGVDMPYAFEAYLLRMLAKEPEERPSAEEAADWFGSDSWRDVAQPMPMPAPTAAPGRAPEPMRAPAAAPGPAPTAAYAPVPSSAPPAAPGGRRRSGGGRSGGGRSSRGGRSPKVLIGVVAGAAAFVVAALVGSSVFGPSDGGQDSQKPEAQPSESAQQEPGGPDPGPARDAPNVVPAEATPAAPSPVQPTAPSKQAKPKKSEDPKPSASAGTPKEQPKTEKPKRQSGHDDHDILEVGDESDDD
ncbi:protein kinase [Streptomyces netropsis]|uniref:serine/threonine-protein kinase n=1 Tax=Streptomyces netropsis TaxID=55404 RepID=UPI003789D8FD